MQQIDISAVRGASIETNKTIKPTAVSAVCPACNSKGVFTLGEFSQPGPQNSVSAAGRCPSCSATVGFWALNPTGGSTVQSLLLYMSPAPKNFFPNPAEMDAVPDPLRRALVTTIEAYNAGVYAAAAVSGRRTLEGIFKFLVPEEKRNQTLFRLIDAAKAEVDLAAPLNALSHAIRTGGNLGAHFDMEREPTEAVARQIVELLTYLVSYLYVLPARIAKLEADLQQP